MADKEKAKVDLGLLEEDDEFEEFPAEGNLNRKWQTFKLYKAKQWQTFFSNWIFYHF